ncbi:MAG: polysaccharide deacetylase family protein [Firmicutes bacterium]|nr:polysaccharide deacetylase family protein [Bacillota bacterium]
MILRPRSFTGKGPARLALAVTLAVAELFVACGVGGPAARATPAGTGPVAGPVEVVLDAGAADGCLSGGVVPEVPVRVSVSVRVDQEGLVEWRLPGTGRGGLSPVSPRLISGLRLSGPDGEETEPVAEESGLRTTLRPGRWTLSYTAPLEPLAGGRGLVLAPARLALLPGQPHAVRVSVRVPEGWEMTPSVPAVAAEEVDPARLGGLNFFVTPRRPETLAELKLGGVVVRVVSHGGAGPPGAPQGSLEAATSLLSRTTAVLAGVLGLALDAAPLPYGEEHPAGPVVNLFLGPPEPAATAAGLDALWLALVPSPPDPTVRAVLERWLWPSARHAALACYGFPDEESPAGIAEVEDPEGLEPVSLRAVAAALGAPLVWDEVGRRAVLTYRGSTLAFPAGSYRYLKDGKSHFAGAASVVRNGELFVDPRGLARGLGCTFEVAAQDRRRVVYLTFDDGPDPCLTPRILDVLAAYHVQATFFVVGSSARRHPELLRRTVREGHALANHTMTHDLDPTSPSWVYRSPEAYLEEIRACDRAIAAATGLHPRWTRPPGGGHPHLTGPFRSLLAAHGYLTIDWDLSAADSARPRPSADTILTRIVEGVRRATRDEIVILMHDGGGDHGSTLEALPAVLEFLLGEGFVFATLR